ncbi:MAG: HAD family hydrolase [Opitutales bacterium]|nr:HAD family hydrolase [Opitutales bacterium]
MSIRHIIWDWNGTLLDDVWLCVDVLNGMLAERGLPPVDSENYRRRFRFPVVEVYRDFGFDVSNGEFERMSHVYINAYESRRHLCKLHAGAEELLGELKSAGLGQSILSAYRQDMLDSMVKNMGLSQYFDHLAGNSDIYAASKVDYGRRLLAKIGGSADEVLMVGDTEHDHEVAHELGIQCILLEHGHNERPRLEKTGAKILPDMRAIAKELGLRNKQP